MTNGSFLRLNSLHLNRGEFAANHYPEFYQLDSPGLVLRCSTLGVLPASSLFPGSFFLDLPSYSPSDPYYLRRGGGGGLILTIEAFEINHFLSPDSGIVPSFPVSLVFGNS